MTKSYKNKTVVDGVSLHVKRGEIYGCVGPNGAGKSTIMKMLLNLIPADSGEIYLFGEKLTDRSYECLKRMGSIIENPYFYDRMSARQNLEMYCDYMGYHNRERIGEVLEEVSLHHAENKPVSQFSLGMKQRLAIARAILTKPEQTKDSFASVFQMTSILLPFLFLVYAAVLTATFVIGEYNTRTITILFACPLNKKQLIAAKLIIIAGFTAAAMAAGYLLCCGYLIGADAAFDMLEDSFQPALLPRFASAAGSSILACAILSLWSFIVGMIKKSVPAAIISILLVFFLRQVMLSKDSLIQESIGQIAAAALITAIAMYVVFRKKVTAID